MKNILLNLLLLIISLFAFVFSKSVTGIYNLVFIYISGMFLGCFLMRFSLNVKDDKLKSFKKELEKESLSNEEAISRVKILESKIEVLEKALENALKR